MTGKQRAYLRGLANSIDAKYQIGKGGIDEQTIRMHLSARLLFAFPDPKTKRKELICNLGNVRQRIYRKN